MTVLLNRVEELLGRISAKEVSGSPQKQNEEVAPSATPAPSAPAAQIAALQPTAAPQPATFVEAPAAPLKPKVVVSQTHTAPGIEFQSMTLSTRYRYGDNSKGIVTNNGLQNNFALKIRAKFDAAGKYTLNANAATGNNFTGGWNNAGPGTGKLATNVYLKQLYFEAKPAKGVQFQYGSLGFTRGESTEITSYDNDAYLTGERLSVRQPKTLWFDEIAVTYGYLGDLNKPEAYQRFGRLKESNYHQVLLTRKLGRISLSGDYTFQSGVETLRQGAKVDTTGSGIANFIQFESYERLDSKADSGFAAYGERSFGKRFKAGMGFASIDPNYGGLNADRFNKGQRAYLTTSLNLTSELSVATFVQRAFGNDYPVNNRQRFDLVFNYNLLKRLQASHFPGFAGASDKKVGHD